MKKEREISLLVEWMTQRERERDSKLERVECVGESERPTSGPLRIQFLAFLIKERSE